MSRMKEPCQFLMDGEWLDGYVIEDCGDGFFYVQTYLNTLAPFSRAYRLGSYEIRDAPTTKEQECRGCGVLFEYDEDADYCSDCTEENAGECQPDEEDAFLVPTGQLGAMTLALFGTKVLGEFERESRARAAIRLEMCKTHYYPNVWVVSDHGNYIQTTL